jgi:hypothetical protein
VQALRDKLRLIQADQDRSISTIWPERYMFS